MNEQQKCALNILIEFINVCKQLDLKYFLVCGSALGAVKYQGFIPWDDDIDVGMPRPDYDIFVANAQKLLPDYLFLQNYKTDKKFPHVFSKLRNSNTTLVEESVAHLDMNHGIYIDVFPLDACPGDQETVDRLNEKKRMLCRRQYCVLKGDNRFKVKLRNLLFRILGYHKVTHITLSKMEKLISQFPFDSAELWCNHGNWQGVLEYAPKWHYGEGTRAVFEGIEVIIPENFDAYLSQKYGEWRKELPKEKQVSHHRIKILDTEKPYSYYVDR